MYLAELIFNDARRQDTSDYSVKTVVIVSSFLRKQKMKENQKSVKIFDIINVSITKEI